MAVFDVDTDGGGSYSELASALAALPATATEEDTITGTGSTVDTNYANVNSSTRTASFPLNIIGDDQYVLQGNNSGALILNEDYVNVTALQVIMSSAASYASGISMYANNGVCDRCYVEESTSSSDARGIIITSGVSGNVLKNSIVKNIDGTSAQGIRALTGEVYNCTVIGCTTGFIGTSNTTVNNVAVLNSSSADYNSFTPSAGANNASSDTSAPGSSPITSVPYSTATFTSVTGGSEDFHLVGTGSDLYHAGVPVTGVDYDYDGVAWDASAPSVGAYEYAAGGGGGATVVVPSRSMMGVGL